MTNRIRGALPVALAIVAVAAPAAGAAPVSVNLRVEGPSSTIFDGPVTTDGHAITTASSGGSHPCDGTNAGAHPSPVPTATAALDDGARLNGFSWDADWFSSFSDFSVKQVAGESANLTQFWGLVVNLQFSQTGGCTTKVNNGDEVLWVFDAFSKTEVLKLSGPTAATTGTPVTVQVVHADDGAAATGATVNGSTTGSDGKATLSFADAGIYKLKADRADAVRSNALTLCVDPPGADPCSSSDKAGPSVAPSLPGRRLASERGRSRTLLISWQASDAAGAGVSHYSVDVRELADGVRASQAAGDWKPIVERTALTGVHFRGDSGSAYEFRITAVDRAANRTTIVTDPLVLPVDDRDRGLWRLSPAWKRMTSATAWGGTVVRAAEAGATGSLRFTGRYVSLVGRRLAKGGRLRVTLDGKSRTLRLRGSSGPRSVLWTSPRLRPGSHLLRLRTLGGGPVVLDAVAPRP
jgi:hypothetical protein